MSAVFDKTYTKEPAMQRTALLNYDSDRRRNMNCLYLCAANPSPWTPNWIPHSLQKSQQQHMDMWA